MTPDQMTPDQMTFDRAVYMSFMLDGTIMDRDAQGNVIVNDNGDAIDRMAASEDYLDRGGEITLTVKGVPFSKVISLNDAYREVRL